MKTAETTLPQLNWLVAKLEGFKYINVFHGDRVQIMVSNKKNESYDFNPTEGWHQGGPIIERECINAYASGACSVHPKNPEYWVAEILATDEMITQYGPTPLIAAMRCFVSSRLGDEVEIPEDLK